MLISSACMRKVGPWDESYFLYSEETDFCARARAAGFTLLFEPEAEAVHLGGDSGVSPPLHALLTVNRGRFYRRSHGPVAGAALVRAGRIGPRCGWTDDQQGGSRGPARP